MLLLIADIFILLASMSIPDIEFDYYHNIHVINASEFALISSDRLSIQLFTISDGKITFDRKIGGKGQGPGEFNGAINVVRPIGDKIIVTTYDYWVHFFDSDFKFIERVFVKDAVIYDIYKIADKYICSMMSLANASHYGGNHFLSIRKDLTQLGDPQVSQKYSIQKPLSNFYLSKRILGVGNKYVVSSQEGSDIVFFTTYDGVLVNAIKLQNIEFNIPMYKNESPIMAIFRERLKQFGVTDFRMPLGGNVESIRSGQNITLIRGGLSTSNRTSSVSVVNHANWKLTSTVIPDRCIKYDVYNDKLHCLAFTDNEYRLSIYDIVVD